MDEYSNVTIACMKCKKKVPIKSMRYSKNGEDLICIDCHNIEMSNAQSSVNGLIKPMPTLSASSTKTDKHKTKDLPSQKISYECSKCGYRFSRNKEVIVNLCPYCNGGPLAKNENFGFYSV